MLLETAEAMWEELLRFRRSQPRAGGRVSLLCEGARADAFVTFQSVKFCLDPFARPTGQWEVARGVASRFSLQVREETPRGPESREMQLLRGDTLVARLRPDKLFVISDAADLPLFRELVRLYLPGLVKEPVPRA
ncbi:MAG: hypothetical protein HY558_05220 [Euryarchaeota archaeon]|nr:hypothetical protein [Euryarchaeota archaeon]